MSGYNNDSRFKNFDRSVIGNYKNNKKKKDFCHEETKVLEK